MNSLTWNGSLFYVLKSTHSYALDNGSMYEYIQFAAHID